MSSDAIADSGTHATVVRTVDGFAALRGSWDALNEASENGSVFARWDWIRTWLDVFATPATPLSIVCVWRGNALIGIAPFWVKPRHRLGIAVRTLRFLGTGEDEADEVLPEYLDIICRSTDSRVVCAHVARALLEDIAWDTATFPHVLPGSVLESELLPQHGQVVATKRMECGARYRIAWRKGEPPSLPPAVTAKLRKLQRAGHVECTWIQDAAELDAAFEVLAELHAKRWRARGAPGVFESQRFVLFHKSLAASWVAQDAVRLRILRIDGAPVAALYNFRWRGIECFYQSGVDAQRKGLSPGIALHALAIQDAARSGDTAYDFLGGETDSYKGVFGAHAEPLLQWTLYRTAWRAQLSRLINREG